MLKLSNHSGVSWKEKKQSTSSSKNCSQPVSLKPPWRRTYFPLVLPRTQPLETPCLSAGSSPTFISVSK
ncbi:hypothetical protein AMECASPLE_035882 [Ameca splendens]|uniref:Uncharacterized protein n=1 Tax=Ameca splendens TaxID=208324 RepID=A0ABV1A3Y6_9TELE